MPIQEVNCPSCGATAGIDPVTVLHPGDTNLVRLFRGELNRFECEVCQASFTVNVPMEYVNRAEGHLVVYVAGDGDWAVLEREMGDLAKRTLGLDPAEGGVEIRLTLSRRDFIEKIAVFTQGLEDRVIEYLKYQLYNRGEEPIDSVRYELRYDFSDPDPERVAFLVFDRETGAASAAAHYPRPVYDDLASLLSVPGRRPTELDQLFPGFYVSVERLLA